MTAIIVIYVAGLIAKLFIVAMDADLGGDTDGSIFRVIFWPVDWTRHVWRSFGYWRQL